MMVQRRLARAVCPDAEALAQLIDGLCGGGTHLKILSHLDSCPLCLNVFMESQRFVLRNILHPAPKRHKNGEVASSSPPASS